MDTTQNHLKRFDRKDFVRRTCTGTLRFPTAKKNVPRQTTVWTLDFSVKTAINDPENGTVSCLTTTHHCEGHTNVTVINRVSLIDVTNTNYQIDIEFSYSIMLRGKSLKCP